MPTRVMEGLPAGELPKLRKFMITVLCVMHELRCFGALPQQVFSTQWQQLQRVRRCLSTQQIKLRCLGTRQKAREKHQGHRGRAPRPSVSRPTTCSSCFQRRNGLSEFAMTVTPLVNLGSIRRKVTKAILPKATNTTVFATVRHVSEALNEICTSEARDDKCLNTGCGKIVRGLQIHVFCMPCSCRHRKIVRSGH